MLRIYEKASIRKLIRAVRKILVYLFRSKMFLFIFDELVRTADKSLVRINHEGTLINLVSSSVLTSYRVRTFSSKEPDTLAWISNFQRGKTFWDIGANVGLYSIYAALKSEAKVVAIEPVPANVQMLMKNLRANHLENQVVVIPLSLTNITGVASLSIPSDEAGISHVVFRESFDFEGKKNQITPSLNTVGLSWKDMQNWFNLEIPNYVKIDVDGIEHLILEGAGDLLNQVEEVLVEVNYNFLQQKQSIMEIMTRHGFILTSENVSPLSTDLEHRETRNQIWVKIQQSDLNS
jgi:FkbM family methyltransferase